MRTHHGERPAAAALEVDKTNNAATEGSGETHDESQDGDRQAVLEDGAFYEPYNDFELPT
eukprot:8511459-Prorocentrum_lima.AAC.1